METLKQIRIAVVGMPDASKSTFISTMLKVMLGRVLSTDTLMNEVHWSDGRDPYGNPDTRTIKCAKILMPYKDVEFCFYDCPGHKEYGEQINQGLEGAHGVVRLIDNKRWTESQEYFEDMDISKPMLTLYSHSDSNWFPHYDAESEGFERVCVTVLEHFYNKFASEAIDVEQEAMQYISENVHPERDRCLLLFSGGKDSIVGMDMLNRLGMLQRMDVCYMRSGYDFPEVEEQIQRYAERYGISIRAVDNSGGKRYGEATEFEMLQEKAKANNRLIEGNYDMVCVQFRASDEGVRSKDYYLSDRGSHKRLSTVFYFSESNIWRYISKHNIPVCPLYFDGYRSLGDATITGRCMPQLSNAEEIVAWIEAHLDTTERDGRKAQDGAVKFTMEKIRNNGFF